MNGIIKYPSSIDINTPACPSMKDTSSYQKYTAILDLIVIKISLV
jgi:hypothetical protein